MLKTIRQGEILDATILKRISDELILAKVKEKEILIQANKKIPEQTNNVRLFVRTIDHKNNRILANLIKTENIIQEIMRTYNLPQTDTIEKIINLFIKFNQPLVEREIRWFIEQSKVINDLEFLFALKLKLENYQALNKIVSYFANYIKRPEVMKKIGIQTLSKAEIKRYISNLGTNYENLLLLEKIKELKTTLKYELLNELPDEQVLETIRSIEYQNIRSFPPVYYYFQIPILYDDKRLDVAEIEISNEDTHSIISIILRLKNLGEIKIVTESYGNKNIVISFFVESNKIKHYIEKNLERLDSILEKLGYKPNSLNVKLKEQLGKMSYLKSIDYWA